MLFLWAESPDPIQDCTEQGLARQLPVLLQGLNQARFAKFFASLVAGFGDAIGVKSKNVTGSEVLLAYGAVPFPEQRSRRVTSS